MKQLDPKAVWWFFAVFLLRIVFLTLLLVFILWLMSVVPVSSRTEAARPIGEFFLSLFFALITPMRIFGLLIIVPIIGYVIARLTYHFYRYGLTDESLKMESGIISKYYVTITFNRIQNINIQRGLIERLLGLSTLKIDTAGTGHAEIALIGLSENDARQLKEEILTQMKAVQNKDQGL